MLFAAAKMYAGVKVVEITPGHDRGMEMLPALKELKDMDKPELIEVVRLKDIMIAELREEIEIYRELAEQLQDKLARIKNEV